MHRKFLLVVITCDPRRRGKWVKMMEILIMRKQSWNLGVRVGLGGWGGRWEVGRGGFGKFLRFLEISRTSPGIVGDVWGLQNAIE